MPTIIARPMCWKRAVMSSRPAGVRFSTSVAARAKARTSPAAIWPDNAAISISGAIYSFNNWRAMTRR